MSQELHNTKRRITSVKSTKKITRAMQLVATAKLSFYKERFISSQLYNKTLSEIVRYAYFKSEGISSPYFEANGVEGKLYIIVTSNLGLCAGYNYNLYKMIDEQLTSADTVLVIGTKGLNHYKKAKVRIIDQFAHAASTMDYTTILKIGDLVIREFEQNKFSQVEFVYTEYVNSLTFIPNKVQLLPIDFSDFSQEKDLGFGILMEPDKESVINALMPQYVKSIIYAKLLESQVAEQASRRTAMENATNNADEIEEKLLLKYHKARQASITIEITEIVAGANKG